MLTDYIRAPIQQGAVVAIFKSSLNPRNDDNVLYRDGAFTPAK